MIVIKLLLIYISDYAESIAELYSNEETDYNGLGVEFVKKSLTKSKQQEPSFFCAAEHAAKTAAENSTSFSAASCAADHAPHSAASAAAGNTITEAPPITKYSLLLLHSNYFILHPTNSK